jgi:type I restriction enzyme S subunit
MKRKGILSTENTERMEVGAVSSGRSVVNTEDLPDGFQMTELGPLPKEWRVVRLGEVAAITSGGSAPQGEQYFLNGKNPFVRVQHLDIDGDYVRRWDLITDEAVEHYRLKKFPAGTIVFPKSGAAIRLEKRAILLVDAHIVSHLCAVLPKTGKVDRWFIFYSLRAKRLAEDKAEGYPVLNLSEIRDVPIPLPPLPEQRAIAHVLRTVQRAKETTEGVIAALKELKKSLMQHLFTYGPVPVTERERVPLQETELGPIPAHWRVVRLGEVVEKTKQIDPRKKPEWFFKYVDVSSVDNELLRITSYQNFAGKEAPSRARKQIDAGDVLFATVRPYLKRIAIVPPELEGHICSTAFCVLRAKNEIDACYLFFAVAHEPFVQRVAEHQRGSSYPAVTDQDVLREVIPLPPLDEQREIARMLQAVDAKIAAEQARRAALEEVFKTLLHQLMTGKVRVKGFHLPELE